MIFILIILATLHTVVRTSFAASPAPTSYVISAWETEDGMPENSATSMVQTPDGYLWFGTFSGLVRFDGLNFSVFDRSNTPNLPGSGIVNLYRDRTGAMWVSTTQGLACKRGERWENYGPEQGWSGNYVRSFTESASGRLIMSTFDGWILEFRAGRFEAIPTANGVPEQGYLVALDSKDNLWAAQPTRYLGRFDGTKWDESAVGHLGGTNNVEGLGPARDGSVWVHNRTNIFRASGTDITHERTSSHPIEALWSLTEDSHGCLWLASYRHGLTLLTPTGETKHFTRKNGLSYDATRFSFEDREGNIWVGTSGGGLMQFKERRFLSWTERHGLSTRVVKTVVEGNPGQVYVGSFGGGLFLFENGAFTPQNRYRELINGDGGYVQSLLHDRSGTLWIGTLGDGLFRQSAVAISAVPLGGVQKIDITALHQDRQGIIWAATSKALYKISEDGRDITQFRGDIRVRVLVEDPHRDRLWVGTDDAGLYKIEGNTIEQIGPKEGFPKSVVSALAVDGDTLWIGSADHGLYRFRNQEFKLLLEGDGLPARAISSILIDGQGQFWIGSNRGVILARREDLNAVLDGSQPHLSSRLFSKSDGLLSVECPVGRQNAGIQAHDGSLWFCTLNGIVSVDPNQIRINRAPVPVIIQSVSTNDENWKPGGTATNSISFRPGVEFLEIQYAGLNYSAPDKVKFRYRLDGVDKSWVEAGNSREAIYRSIKPGKYVFRIIACNNDNFWNQEEVVLGIAVLPFFWQTVWFQGTVFSLIVLLAAALAWVGSRRKVRQELRELKQKRELLQVQARLASVLESTTDLVAFFTPDWKLSYINKAGVEMLGYEKESELLGREISLWMSREVFEMMRAQALPRTLSLGSWAAESTVLTRKGSLVPVSMVLVAHRDEHGKGWDFCSINARDITEAREAAKALQDSEERYRSLIENSGDLAAELSDTGRIVYASPNFQTLLGYTSHELIGTVVENLLKAEDQAELREQLAQQKVTATFRARDKQGGDHWIESVAKRFQTAGGQQRTVVIWRDISARKAAEVERARMEEQLRQSQKLEALGTLAGGIAHDFNNILAAMTGYAEYMRLLTKEPQCLEAIDQILQSGERARDLVKQILFFSRKTKPEKKIIQLAGVVSESLKMLRASLPANVEIQSEFRDDTPLIHADSTQIQQVLVNLCTNASHAMRHSPGQILVRVDGARLGGPGHRGPANIKPGQYARLTVRDTGHGIDSDTLKKIFEPFFTTKAPGQGTGLGLAVVQGIVQEHGGGIAVESVVGRGSTFEVYLPAAEASLPAATRGPRPEVPRGTGQRVLFVDDELSLCNVAHLMLKNLGYDVTSFIHPTEAIHAFTKKPNGYDLVITDLTMPGMLGIDLARKLHALRPDLPIILASGFTADFTAEDFQNAGVTEVLLKPLTIEELGIALHRVLKDRPTLQNRPNP